MARHQTPAEARESDQRVLDKVRYSPCGASAVDVAKASLGWKARKHNKTSLTMIGLAIATRLIGEGRIRASRSNLFLLAEPQGSDAAGRHA